MLRACELCPLYPRKQTWITTTRCPLCADETKDQREQNGEDNRCHDREIDTDISIRTLVFDVTWKKWQSGGTFPFGLMSPGKNDSAGVALGILVSARRSRSASQLKRPRARTTTVKILRNVYMT